MGDGFEAEFECEDLLFESSPLSKYLQEIGNDDFSSYSTGLAPATTETKKDLGNGASTKTNFFVGNITLTACLTKLRECFFGVLTPSSSATKELKTTAQMISSKFSSFENVLTGSNMDNGKGGLADTAKKEGFYKKNQWPSLTLMSIMVLQLSAALGSAMQSNQLPFHFSILVVANLLILATIVSHLFCKFYFSKQVSSLCADAIYVADQFICSSESICKTFDKCFLLIRECEVISMGSIFYHPSMPMLKRAPRKRGMCTALRKCLEKHSLSYFECTKSLALQLVNCLPNHLKLLYTEDGICSVASENIKSSFDRDSYVDEGVLTSAMIKGLICLMRSQLVELFQIIRLLLQCTPETKIPDDQTQLMATLKSLKKLLVAAIKESENTVKDVESVYCFTKENEFEEREDIKQPRAIEQRFIWDLKVDSSFLHLKSAIGFLKQLQVIFIEDIFDEGTPHLDILSRIGEIQTSKIRNLLDGIKHDLEGVKDCVNDIEELFEVANFVKDDTTEEAGVDTCPLPISNDVKVSPNTSLTEVEGDLFLEAMSDPDGAGTATKSNNLSNFEEEQYKHQRESKMLMSELKAIFSHKKDPVGLLPFDLVKKSSLPYLSERIQERLDDDLPKDYSTKDVSEEGQNVEENLEQEQFYQSNYPTCYSAFGTDIINELTCDSNSNPPIDILTDLRAEILRRQATNAVSELTIEGDTFGSDDVVCSDEE